MRRNAETLAVGRTKKYMTCASLVEGDSGPPRHGLEIFNPPVTRIVPHSFKDPGGVCHSRDGTIYGTTVRRRCGQLCSKRTAGVDLEGAPVVGLAMTARGADAFELGCAQRFGGP